MSIVTLTGASGTLGAQLLAHPAGAGHQVRAMSRRDPAHGSYDPHSHVTWRRADLVTGAGLDDALAGADVVLHAATAPGRGAQATDVAGTERLLAAARGAGVRHLVFVSIVGVDRIPVAYYRAKVAAESLVRGGGVPWTIVRGTQFHSFMDGVLRRFAVGAFGVAPAGFRCQPMDAAAFAGVLWEVVGAEPAERILEVGGPRVSTWDEMLRARLSARGRHPWVVSLPIPGAAAAALRDGAGTTARGRMVGPPWEEWLASRYRAGSTTQGGTAPIERT